MMVYPSTVYLSDYKKVKVLESTKTVVSFSRKTGNFIFKI